MTNRRLAVSPLDILLLVVALVSGLAISELFCSPRAGRLVAGGAEEAIPLPFTREREMNETPFRVETELWNLFPIGSLRIIPDDCVERFSVGGVDLDLSRFGEPQLCDWRDGIVLDVRNFRYGKIPIALDLKNKAGVWGVTIEREASRLTWVILLLAFVGSLFTILNSRLELLVNSIERHRWVAPVAVLLISYVTLIHNYQNPPGFFWDENYHVASAEKYLHHVFFMEPHPPAGKLFIALGERWFGKNDRKSEYTSADHLTTPTRLDMRGYRLFPVLFAWLSCYLFYAILAILTGSAWLALAMSLLVAFDNSFILHSRAAMLDSTFLFFCLAFVLGNLRAWRSRGRAEIVSLTLAGAALGLACATKVLALILLPVLIISIVAMKQRHGRWRGVLSRLGILAAVALISYCAIWQIHFSLGRDLNPKLSNQGYYEAGPALKAAIVEKRVGGLSTFFLNLSEQLAFGGHYHHGVPKLNLCKSDENGSPWFFWPFGGRSINYRWEKTGPGFFRYLYLVCNPVVWGVGLSAILLALAQLAGCLFFRADRKIVATLFRDWPLVLLVALYLGYLINIDWAMNTRVLYLYHYFLPLWLSLMVASLLAARPIYFLGGEISLAMRNRVVAVVVVLALVAFLIYKPFSYFEGVTNASFQSRPAVVLWDLRCMDCPPTNPYYTALGS